MRNRNNFMRTFIRYMRDTWKNKIYAIGLILLSLVPIYLEGEGTAFVLALFIAIPMFFSKRTDWLA